MKGQTDVEEFVESSRESPSRRPNGEEESK